MKLNFLTLPEGERRLYIEQAAIRRNLSPVVLEKDFWVCWPGPFNSLFSNSVFLLQQVITRRNNTMEGSKSLWERFAEIPDPRSKQGQRHSLAAILSLITVATLCGARSLEAVAQFARDRGRRFAESLGFTHETTPCKATLSNTLRRLDPEAVERTVSDWVRDRIGQSAGKQIAIDGKSLCGSSDGALPCVHLLSAFAPHADAVLAQFRVDAKTNEHKAALEAIGLLPVAGNIVTADAMFTHRDFVERVIQAGGDYILPVKENQSKLRADIALAFETPEALSPSAACDFGK
jgi:hypothetical protein